MTTPAEKQNRATKRGCIWLLIAAPSLLLIYLFLLSTSVFDSKPVSYPDLEIKPEGKTIPLLEALEACPDWKAWRASEEKRDGLISDLRSEEPSTPVSEIADKLRPEVTRAIALADWLLEKPEPLGLKPIPESTSIFEISHEDAGEMRNIFSTLRASLSPQSASRESADFQPLGPRALRLLAKCRPLGDALIGCLSWVTSEARIHGLISYDIHQWAGAGDKEKLQDMLRLLDDCRPSNDEMIRRALKTEFSFMCRMMVEARSRLGNFGAGVIGFGPPSSLPEQLTEQWTLLRLQPNKCSEILAGDFRRSLRFSTLPPRDRVWPVPAANSSMKMISPAPNAGGLVLLDIAGSTYQKVLEVNDHGLARHHLLRSLIGLALYRIDHGNELPADLSALVPAYLPEVPKDPYTGEPPLYDPAAGKLAFRGLDFVPSSAPVDAEKEKKSRERGLPAGVGGLFEPDGPHDPGVDLKAFFEAPAGAVAP